MPIRQHVSAPPTPVSLLGRLGRGTESEWRRFNELYAPFTYRLALAAGLATADAEDVAAEVMATIMKQLREGFKLDPQRGRFRQYLATIVQRAVQRLRRRSAMRRVRDRRAALAALTGEPGQAESLAYAERLERLRLCIRQLRDDPDVRKRDFSAFEDYALKEMPAESVARRYKLTRGRVYQIKSEMLNRIEIMMGTLERELGEV